MKKLRVVLYMAAMFAFLYCVLDLSGVTDYFDDMINERNGWVSVDEGGGYARTKLETKHYWYISILNDPEVSEFNLYMPPVKREAVDRMTHIMEVTVEMKHDETNDDFYDRIKLMAQHKNGNVVIVNQTGMYQSITSETWGLGL